MQRMKEQALLPGEPTQLGLHTGIMGLPGVSGQHMEEQALLLGLHMGIMGLPGVSGQHMEALANLASNLADLAT